MPNLLLPLKTLFWNPVRSHWELLSFKERDIYSFLSSPYRIILIVFYTILFLPHVFVMVEDITLLAAYEVDPGSIVNSIRSLYEPAYFYDMNAPYHSRFYGWTYYWINFILVAPVYILMALKVLQGYFFFLVSIRLVLFLIGLASLLAFFEVARRSLKNELLSFVAGLLYIASPAVSKFFYFIHPETTGLLFLFLALLCLIQFHEESATDLRWYRFALLSLTLSILSKHVFLFTALPVFFLFLYIYCYHRNISLLHFILSRQFVQVLLGSVAFSVFIFFIINPFAFFQLSTFLTNQLLLFSTQTQGSLTEVEATKEWLDILQEIPIILISIILFPFSLLGAILLGTQKVEKMLYIVNLIGSVFFILFSVFSLRYIIYEGYLAPIYPLFILNILSIPLFIVRKWNVMPLKFITLLSLGYFLFFNLIKDFSVSLPIEWARLKYQDSLAYQSYHYIETKIPEDKKVIYDHFVAVPSDKRIISCQYWQGCTDYIEEFRPDYLIFAGDWTFEGITLPEKARMIQYADDHDFILIDTIGGDVPNEGEAYSLEVWKKP